MNRAILLVWTILCLLAAANCQDQTHTITIVTDPPGALVRHNLDQLGYSGEPIKLDYSKLGETFEISVQLEGHKEQVFLLQRQKLQNQTRYPADGALLLTPESSTIQFQYWLKKNKIVLALVLPVLLVGALFGRKRWKDMKTAVARQASLERYKDSALSKDSIIMQILSGYRVVDALGEGGMAMVYKGLPENTLDESEMVAIKVLKSVPGASGPEFQERFRREVKTYAELSHPNIVRLIDWDEIDDRTYMVLEFVDGDTLRDLLDGKQLSTQEMLKYISPAIEAIAFAHSKGIVHRDLKPENIMVTKKGLVKVMDFGLARAEDSKKLTQTGQALGTPSYMAPEQIQSAELDPRMDQYALGVMAFEMLVGHPPFDDPEPLKVIFKHLTEPAPSVCSLVPSVPPEVDAVIQKMLSKDASDRYLTLAETLEALHSAV